MFLYRLQILKLKVTKIIKASTHTGGGKQVTADLARTANQKDPPSVAYTCYSQSYSKASSLPTSRSRVNFKNTLL